MSKKFTPEQTLHLVTLYRDHECLWNTHSRSYKNKHLKNRALQQMCADLCIRGFTVNDLKIKIKTIRSTYCIELDKIEKSNGTEFPYKPRVIWFDVLNSFIRDVTIKKKRATEDDDEHSDCRNDGEPTEQVYSNDVFLDDEEIAQVDNIKYEEQDSQEQVTYGIIIRDMPGSTPEPTKRKIYQLDSTNNTVKLITDKTDVDPVLKVASAPKLRRIAPKPTENYDKFILPRDHTYHAKVHAPPKDDAVLNDKQDDEFDTFGKHVANQLRKLSEFKYIMAQEEIQTTITKFLMGDINA